MNKKALFILPTNKYYNSINDENTNYTEYYRLQKELYDIEVNDYFEIPLWITNLTYTLKNKNIECKLFKINKLDEDTIIDLNIEINNSNFVFGSVLSMSNNLFKDIIKSINKKHLHKITLGTYGHIEFDTNEITITNNMIDVVKKFGDFDVHNDYSLFEGDKVVPRLVTTIGCFNNCSMCTVPNTFKYVSLPTKRLKEQVAEISKLKFKYIYIDDKTFIAKSHIKLRLIYNLVKLYNQEFEGFIIQTTINELKTILQYDTESGFIKYIEIGLETIIPEELKLLNKPYNIDDILDTFDYLYSLMKTNAKIPMLIINMITHLPNSTLESITNNISFLSTLTITSNLLSHINVCSLSTYENTKIYEYIKTLNNDNFIDGDFLETNIDKSFLTKNKNDMNAYYFNTLQHIGINVK